MLQFFHHRTETQPEKICHICKGKITMKKYPVLILVVILTFVLVIPVATKSPGLGGNGSNFPTETNGTQTAYTQMQQAPRQTFAMVGSIAAIDTVMMTLIINVINGYKLARGSNGGLVTVFTADATRYLLKAGTLVAPISFGDLEMGQKVSLNGIVNVKNEIETWTAYQVKVGTELTQINKI